jgi:cell wall-associated NlpC family hydrolase
LSYKKITSKIWAVFRASFYIEGMSMKFINTKSLAQRVILGGFMVQLATGMIFASKQEASEEENKEKMVVIVPVADLRSKPNAAPLGLSAPALSGEIGDQDSQLLYGECVLGVLDSENSGWVKVSALEQSKYRKSDNSWIDYPGYVKTEQVRVVDEFPTNNLVVLNTRIPVYSDPERNIFLMHAYFGTKFCTTKLIPGHSGDSIYELALPDKSSGFIQASGVFNLNDLAATPRNRVRHSIVSSALTFLGNPYVWGGCSPYDPEQKNITSVDCSALTYLVHRTHDIAIPRDANPQYLKSTKIQHGSLLQPGDLIFWSKKDKEHMHHVALYLGNDQLIETTGLGYTQIAKVREDNLEDLTPVSIRSFEACFGKTVTQINSGDSFQATLVGLNGQITFSGYLYFGTFLTDEIDPAS